MSKWYTLQCESCDFTEYRRFQDEPKETDKTCYYHDTPMTVKAFEDVYDIDIMVEITGCHLEDMNHHSLTHLPFEQWQEIKKDLSFLPHEQQVAIVRGMLQPFLAM